MGAGELRYAIGLDIGITSVGWAIINQDKERIEDLGVRIFDRAENPKNGSSLATPRRDARSARRRLRRKRYRISRIRKFIVERGLLTKTQASQLYDWRDGDLDVWLLRVNGLERKLSDREFARILIHYGKNRGFKSNRKSEASEPEGGELLQAVRKNAKIMEENNYRTVAEMIVLDERFEGRKRNKDGSYSHVLSRSEIEKEIRTVFEKQREYGHSFATHENEERFIEIWSAQRPFSTQDDIEKRIGVCTFEENEKRAPKASFTFEKFRALDKLNRLRIISDYEPSRPLTDKEREQVIDLLFNKKEVKYKDLRKVLSIPDYARFNELYYDRNESNEKNENKTFLSLQAYYKMKKAIKQIEGKTLAESYRPIDYDTFAYALTVYKDDQDAKDYLMNNYVNENGKRIRNIANKSYNEVLIEELLHLSFSKFGHLSLKALNNIMPYIEAGDQYHEACRKAGYTFNQKVGEEKKKLLPVIPTEDIVNHVVIRALSQTRKVLNAIIKRYGSPTEIYIELAREMGRNYTERKELEKQFNKNRVVNENAKKRIQELVPGIHEPRGHDILKYKLWEEQHQRCAYSMKPISIRDLFNAGYAEVDHIIPYSRSFDDSNANKVLVLSQENQNKRNKTPYEWFGHDTKKWEEFVSFVNSLKVSKKKKDLLLKQNFDDAQAEEFKSRHLNDTRYITRYLKKFIEDNLLFREEKDNKQTVFTVNGAYTALMRKRWGFNKNRQENDLHHALDAAIVAVSRPFRHRVSAYFKRKEEKTSQYIKREGERFPEPWDGFAKELEARLIQDQEKLKFALKSLSLDSYDEDFINRIKPIFVSRMPKRSVKGQIHEETLRRIRGYNEKGYLRLVTKTRLQDIPFDKKTGDFPMYGKDSDPKTYRAIKERFLEYGGNVKKAFAEPLYKPSKNPKSAPIIRSVKIETFKNQAVSLKDKAVAENASIVRTEVFRHKKSGKFYLAPVYTSDVMAKRIPERFITANTPFAKWDYITEEYEFLFNLYPNDVIQIKLPRKKKAKDNLGNTLEWSEGIFYFKTIDRGTGSLNIINHMNSFEDRIGSRNLKIFEKYQVDPLGNLKRVKKEKRHGI